MEYTYIAYKTFFVFISSVLLAEEFFKLYRMNGGSMFKFFYLQHRIKEFIQLIKLTVQHEYPYDLYAYEYKTHEHPAE